MNQVSLNRTIYGDDKETEFPTSWRNISRWRLCFKLKTNTLKKIVLCKIQNFLSEYFKKCLLTNFSKSNFSSASFFKEIAKCSCYTMLKFVYDIQSWLKRIFLLFLTRCLQTECLKRLPTKKRSRIIERKMGHFRFQEKVDKRQHLSAAVTIYFSSDCSFWEIHLGRYTW